MTLTQQRTIGRAVEVRGFGLFGSRDCTLRFKPAPENSGISFLRTDLPGAEAIPATTDYVVPMARRTAISNGRATVETIEHAMAALAGLWIDNCLVELDAPEPPVCDGSSLAFVEALLSANIVEQSAAAPMLTATTGISTGDSELTGDIHAFAADRLAVRYDLHYSSKLIAAQSVSVTVTPDVFVNEIAFARTFVLDLEIDGLRRQGFGQRVTTQNLLVIGADGVRDNEFRRPDECARHKILDFIGDLALCGGRARGEFHCRRSGHHHNQAIASAVRQTQQLVPNASPSDDPTRVFKARKPRGARSRTSKVA